MTLDELKATNINEPIAREAHQQAQKRLEDVLNVKKELELKASALFGGYTTLALAVLALAGSLHKTLGLTVDVAGLGAAGGLLTLGAVFFVLALKDQNYGQLGSNPEMWLTEGIINSAVDNALPAMLAYVTYHYQTRIETSIASNRKKVGWLRCGIGCGVLAPLALIVSQVFPPLLGWIPPASG